MAIQKMIREGCSVESALFVAWGCIVLGVLGAGGYVAYHFISKYW